MARVILFNMISLDGFFEGPNHDIDWHTTDEEFNRFSIEQLHSAAGLLFGRVTYELMASYWPTPQGVQDEPEVAALMNTLPKYVFSRSLARAGWQNTTVLRGEADAEVRQLKQQVAGDLLLFGSATLVATLLPPALIDELRLMVSPQVLGAGRGMFAEMHQPLPLRLVDSRSFGNGNVLLVYAPAQSAR